MNRSNKEHNTSVSFLIQHNANIKNHQQENGYKAIKYQKDIAPSGVVECEMQIE